jgi:hypothetical protein
MRKGFAAGGCKDLPLASYDNDTVEDYLFNQAQLWTIGTQLGGFIWSAVNVDKGFVRYRVYNTASLSSFKHNPGLFRITQGKIDKRMKGPSLMCHKCSNGKRRLRADVDPNSQPWSMSLTGRLSTRGTS